jgi:hypothetical protein
MIKKVTCTAFVLLLVLLFVVSSATPARAQAVYGSIIGTITDPQGAAVPNAKVTVTSVRKGTSDTATTNESGNYSVTHLIPDIYDIKIEAQGFKSAEQKGITLNADQASRNDITMQLGSVSEAVEVTAEAPQLKTDRADVATTFNEKYVQDLPVLGRNFTTFELLSPGTQKLVGWNHASTENPQGSQQIFVNGQHFSGTGYELDGTDNQDPILGIIVINPNLDAITETKVALQNYDAEFGKAVAGVVTVQTKSGSNDFHGSGFWFRRTDATEARDPFTQYKPDAITGRFIPQDRWNQFGGTFGGPIIKNKLFFFGDYQGTRQASGITQQLTVPTAQVISSCGGNGDGSGYCKLDQYTSIFGNGKDINGNPYVIGQTPDPSTLLYDPTSGNQITGAGRNPFCGPLGCAQQPNWIPFSQIPASVRNIVALFPSGGTTLQNNLIASGSAPFSANSMDARIDWAASNSVSVFGRFSLARFQLSGTGLLGALDGPGNGLGGLAGSAVTHNYSLSSGVTKTFSPTLLADFRFGYFKYNPQTSKPNTGTPMNDVGVGALGPSGFQPNTGTAFTAGWGSFQGDGPNSQPGVISPFGDGLNVGRCNCPLVESEQQFQFVNNWTKIHGNHTFKVGLDMRYAMNLRVPSDADRVGVYNFRSGTTSNLGVGGNGFGSFLLGDVAEMNRFVSTSTSAAERQKRFFYYAQDTWRATQKLTLSYGLRWEIYFPETVNGKGNGGFANPVEGIIRVAGEGNYGLNGGINNTWKAFAPRLGVAYQITPKTVIRLGYGRSFDIGVFGSNFGHAVTQNLPVLVNQDVTGANNTVNSGLNPTNDPNFAPNLFYAFNLDQGPPPAVFPTPINGVLPLNAANGQPRMRPTEQRLPTLDAWNLTIQHQLTNTMSLEIAYVGNKGTHVFAGNGPAYDLNPPRYGAPTNPVVAFNSTANAVDSSVAAGTSCGSLPSGDVCQLTGYGNQDLRRPFYNAFSIPYTDPVTGLTSNLLCCAGGTMGNYFGNDASANYNALQIKLDKRFSNGLQFQTNFTWSKAMNYSNDNGFQFATNPQLTYGPDDMNRDKVWILNGTYELPFGKGKQFAGNAGRALDLVIGGWQISNTTNVSSGLPWTANAANCGPINDTGPCVPELIGSFKVGAGSFDPVSHTVNYFTPVSALSYPDLTTLTVGTDICNLSHPTSGPFQLAPCGTTGTSGRNRFRGPGAFTDDMSVAKNFHFTERFSGQFRMDAFNIFNHPVYGFSAQDYGATGGTTIDGGGSNGKIKDIQNGTTMRQLQFAVKVFF